jgi:hypothetical protein
MQTLNLHYASSQCVNGIEESQVPSPGPYRWCILDGADFLDKKLNQVIHCAKNLRRAIPVVSSHWGRLLFILDVGTLELLRQT